MAGFDALRICSRLRCNARKENDHVSVEQVRTNLLRQEKISEKIPAAKETIDNIAETVKEKAGEYAEKAENFAHDTVATVKEKVK